MPPLEICRPGPGPLWPVRKYGYGNMDHQEVGLGGMDCINLTQDMDKWQALVNPVMNQWVQPMEGNF